MEEKEDAKGVGSVEEQQTDKQKQKQKRTWIPKSL